MTDKYYHKIHDPNEPWDLIDYLIEETKDLRRKLKEKKARHVLARKTVAKELRYWADFLLQ